MPDKSLSVVAGIYQCNPAIPHNDCIHLLQECLSSGLSPKTLGFKVLKAHLTAHIFLLDMQECVDVAIPYSDGHCASNLDTLASKPACIPFQEKAY